jgi:flagellar hook-length control protein FliK
MRLPQSLSMHGGSLASSARERDPVSFLAPPGGTQLFPPFDLTAGIRFDRPNVDFNTVLTAVDQSNRSSPTTSENVLERPTTLESSLANGQSDSSIRQAETDDDEVDHTSDEPVLAIPQPQALPAEKSPAETLASAEPIATAEIQVDNESGSEQTVDLQLGKSVADPRQISNGSQDASQRRENVQVESVQTQSGDQAPGSGVTSRFTDSDPLPVQTNRSAESLAQDDRAEAYQPEAAENVVADAILTKPGPIKIDPESVVDQESAKVDTPIGAKSLMPASQQPSDAADVNGAAGIQTDFNKNMEPGRRSWRSGQNRTAGNAGRKDSDGERAANGYLGNRSESTNAIDRPSISAQETLAGKPGEPSTTSDAALPGIVSAASSIVENLGSTVGQGLANTTLDTANRTNIGGGTSSDTAAIELRAGDPAGHNNDPTSSGKTENLSRTDIADRARLIHRITKAFAKLGVDGGQVRMKLHPETLGGVLLEMRVRGRQVEATVTADNEVARDLLLQQLPELRQRLESQGMTVNRLEVALQDDSATGGSLSHESHGHRFGDEHGTKGFDQSNRGGPSSAAAKRINKALGDEAGRAVNALAANAMTGPAAPGTLDLRL